MPEETPLTRAAKWFYRTLLVLGPGFYIVWNAVYGCWNFFEPHCAGVYAVTIVLVGFGLLGSLLYAPKKAAQ